MPKKPSGCSQAVKTARPAAKRAAKATIEDLAVAKEELAARRVAGGRDIEAAASDAPEHQHPNRSQALGTGIYGGAVTAPRSVPSGPASAEA